VYEVDIVCDISRMSVNSFGGEQHLKNLSGFTLLKNSQEIAQVVAASDEEAGEWREVCVCVCVSHKKTKKKQNKKKCPSPSEQNWLN